MLTYAKFNKHGVCYNTIMNSTGHNHHISTNDRHIFAWLYKNDHADLTDLAQQAL